MNREQLTFFEVDQPTASTPLSDMPERFQRVFTVLDGYREGRVSGEQVMALDQGELEAARQWKQDWMDARMSEAFPDLDQEDGL
jgi:hypothetical protein